MSNTPPPPSGTWQIAISPSPYNRMPLTPSELHALASIVRLGEYSRGINGADYAREELQRFQEPIYDVLALRITHQPICRHVRRILYLQMIECGRTIWEWTKQEWLALVCPSYQEFVQAHGKLGSGRQSIKDMAYLLGEMTDLRAVAQRTDALQTARLYFGKGIVDEQAGRVFALFVGHAGQGYTAEQAFMERLGQSLGLLFLLNRSPLLADLSPDLLQQASQPPDALRPAQIQIIISALHQLGYLPLQDRSPLHETPAMGSREEGETAGIAPAWAAWCQAWLTHVPKVTPRVRVTYTALLTVGRWLADRHPGIVEPSQWSEELALEYVSYLCSSATVGDYASLQGTKPLVSKGVVGKKLTPRSIKQRLAVLARFFLDLRDRPHRIGNEEPGRTALRFDPRDAFRLPAAVKNLIQPDPRDIDEVLWCKLTYAAATLTAEDYPKTSPIPLSYHKAAALLWITSARRPNEIARLQVGCIRRDWDPAMLDEDGFPLPGKEAQLCYLHVPMGKTKGPFWVPIPSYAADAIEQWERERPKNQPKLLDPKDHHLVDFLFCIRGQRMGSPYINRTLIPALCRRAGVETSDARGAITGHRARSTIATMLRRNGVSLDDLSVFLGHRDPSMVRAYARTDPFRFGRDINRANDLMRIVEGIIDTRAAKAGQPNVFFFLGRGGDGHPRFCGNPAWDKCRHRLACLKCSMYVGAGQASKLAERLEARDELFKFQTRMEMNPQEKAAVEGDIETLTALISAESSTPLPEPPNEQFRFTPGASFQRSEGAEAQTDLAQLARELAALTHELAETEKRTDGRNARVRSLKKRIAAVTERMVALDQLTSLTTPTLGPPS